MLLLAAFVLPSSVLAQQKGEEREYEDLALTGDNVCTRCHDDPNIMKIGRTKHGTRADARTTTCTSCHGESRAHLDNPDGGDVRPVPDVIS